MKMWQDLPKTHVPMNQINNIKGIRKNFDLIKLYPEKFIVPLLVEESNSAPAREYHNKTKMMKKVIFLRIFLISNSLVSFLFSFICIPVDPQTFLRIVKFLLFSISNSHKNLMSLVEESEHLSIPFLDIEIGTKNFSTLIGKGGYGKVYKGEVLLSGKLTTVAVKRLDANISGQGFKEFLTEIQLLSRYKHPNLISLLGFCQERNEKILVYEYAEHGSLDKFLGTALTYKQRISICIGAARGLDYLHNHIAKHHRVIHRDIKSANVLIDHNWKAIISDLGLSKIGRANENDTYLITNASGTHGYCDPVYMDTGILTKESDVYSFGVVLFEVLCGRLCFKNVNDERRFLGPLARRYYQKGKLDEIIDPVLKDQLNSDSLNKISAIAYQCLLNDRSKRPSMGLVLQTLMEAYKIQYFLHPSSAYETSTTYKTDGGGWMFMLGKLINRKCRSSCKMEATPPPRKLCRRDNGGERIGGKVMVNCRLK